MNNNKSIFLILYIFLSILIKQTKSDCSSCTISNKTCICKNSEDSKNCVWFKIDSKTEKCMKCHNMNLNENLYYTKKETIFGQKYCNIIDKKEIEIYKGKIIYGTKQIVDDCKELGYYQLGDICYDVCPPFSLVIKNKKCECYNLYNKTIIDNFTYINCFDNNSKRLLEEECTDYWKYENDKKECITLNDEGNCPEEDYLLIVETKECYKSEKCKEENPLLFNKKCYGKNSCPENSEYIEENPDTCTCSNLWTKNNNAIECLDKDKQECPSEYPNLIITQKQCVKDEDEILSDFYIFNEIYYDRCPTGTIVENESSIKKCVCDPIYGSWTQTQLEDNKISYSCRLSECPKEKNFLVAKTNECINKCSESSESEFSYGQICYDKCPDLTEEKENKICELKSEYTINDDDINESIKNISQNILNLYIASNKGETSGIIALKNNEGEDNSIIEFYGVNQNKNSQTWHNDKEKSSSTLSYIDLSDCFQNLYDYNNMEPTDDILIIKFDLIKTPKEYLINPAEYKFINSKTGRELDVSTCANKNLKISYPFSNIINNYENTKNIRNLQKIMIDIESNDLNSIREKYRIGKEINELYPDSDTFNSKDNMYTDFCSSIEINGKDLVLEDRISFLLPQYSLCEENCTFNHTDFKEERFYCDCQFKREFDLNRVHISNIEINENIIRISQEGPTNFPVLKCISVWKDTKRLFKKNIAFYYNIIIIIILICLLVLALTLGLNILQNYLDRKILNKNDEKTKEGDEDPKFDLKEKKKKKVEKTDGYAQTTENVQTTEKRLNSPPKKKSEEDSENEIQFIPDEYVFIYFNNGDKGVRKKLEKNLIVFDLNKNVKILLQKIDGVDYSKVKANGPFEKDQNILEIIDGNDEKDIDGMTNSYFNENNNDKKDNDIITVQKRENKNQDNIYSRKKVKNFIFNENDEEVEENNNKNDSLSFLDKMKIEQILLTKEYKFVESKDNNFLILMLVEILDKIYIIKIFLFLNKY